MIFFGNNNQNVDIVKQLARQIIESTYDCLCDVIEYQSIKNETNKRTEHKEVTVLENKPCKVSYKTISNSNQTETENSVSQIVKLFIAPEIQIKSRFKDYCY